MRIITQENEFHLIIEHDRTHDGHAEREFLRSIFADFKGSELVLPKNRK